MKQLLEDYQRRLKTIMKEVAKGGNDHTLTRLGTKASCYRTFISELEKCIKEQKKRGYILSYKGLYNIENKYYMNFNTKKDFVKILYLKK